MRAFVSVVVFLIAVFEQGDCLSCETCQAQGSISCNGTLQTCAEGVTYCVKGFENNTQGSNTIFTAFKKCVDPVKNTACNRSIIFRSAFISLRIPRLCCETDGCNEGDMDVPIINETANGLNCPTCFTDQSAEGCTATETLVCTGNEDFCGSFTGTARRPDNPVKGYSIKGCHNKDACEVGILGMEASQAYDFNLTCTQEPSV